MYILIHNSKNHFSVELPEAFIQVNIRDFYSLIDENEYLYNSNREEFFLNLISESLDKSSYSNVKAVIIDKNLGISDWTRAIGLAGHITCSDYSKCKINTLPIILTDWTSINLEDPSLKDTIINNIFQTEGFYFRKYEDLFSTKADRLTGELKYLIDVEINRLKPIDFKSIGIKSIYDSSHQATNEWGAMRLASNFGLFDKIKFEYPKHLYFKYLLKFIKPNSDKIDESLFGKFAKILLIDDNANCGWIESLENIHKCSVDKRVSSTEVLAWQNTTPEKFDQYDLIYLDLYLEKGKADSTNALSALKFIKGKFPHIPVIIFTASDKAWNLDEVLETGADAMYIKESPLYYRNEEYSIKNSRDFTATIKYVDEKYKILRPYWQAIQAILTDNAFLQIQEKGSSKFKERIKERLEMFFGLLKRGLEQTEFNELRFHFSDYELAFVTLWSILNEISESNFTKTKPSITISDSQGTQITKHPSGNNISYYGARYKWIVKGQSDVFVEYSYSFNLDSSGIPLTDPSGRNFKLTPQQQSCFEYSRNLFGIIPTAKTKTNYETTLFLQIAYLLERKNNLSSCLNRFNFQQELLRLNEIRNHLYLTHGSDVSTGFYNQTEKSKRANHNIKPDKDIKDLFELISILITGKENKVNI